MIFFWILRNYTDSLFYSNDVPSAQLIASIRNGRVKEENIYVLFTRKNDRAWRNTFFGIGYRISDIIVVH